MHGLGHDERLAVAAVEADGDVAGELDVLALVVAHRHLVGVVEEDVGRLQGRVGEQPGRDEARLLGRLVLELRHAAAARRCDDRALHDPAELGVLGHVALDEQRARRRGRARRPGASRPARASGARSSAGSWGTVRACRSTMQIEGVVLVLVGRPSSARRPGSCRGGSHPWAGCRRARGSWRRSRVPAAPDMPPARISRAT